MVNVCYTMMTALKLGTAMYCGTLYYIFQDVIGVGLCLQWVQSPLQSANDVTFAFPLKSEVQSHHLALSRSHAAHSPSIVTPASLKEMFLCPGAPHIFSLDVSHILAPRG